jgi:hypothetical protein
MGRSPGQGSKHHCVFEMVVYDLGDEEEASKHGIPPFI